MIALLKDSALRCWFGTTVFALLVLSCGRVFSQEQPSSQPPLYGNPANTEKQSGVATGGEFAPVLDSEKRPITAGGFVKEGPIVFQDISEKAGLTSWHHWMGTLEKKYIIEVNGSGVALLDYDHDGWLDIYLVNGSTYDAMSGKVEPPHAALFHNNHDGTFTNVAEQAGVTNGRWGTGVAVGDYDNDGWPDIVQANGAMVDNVKLYHSMISYKEPLLMFHNLGNGHFEKSSEFMGADFMNPVAGRGLATADFNNDGGMGIAVICRGDYPEILRNDGGNANHWLDVLLIGTKSNRDGTGSVLKLSSEGVVHVEQAKGGTSYMSSSDPRLHFGLGRRTKIESLTITWPSGQVDKLTDVPIDKIIAVKEGVGIVPHPFPKVTAK